MRKQLALLALVAVPALLTACNGNATTGQTGLSPLPSGPAAAHRGGVRRNDNGAQDLHSGGATFPAYGYNLASQPVGYYYDNQPGPGAGSVLAKVPTTGTVYYCLTGSGAGRKAFEGYNDSSAPPTGPCAPLGQTPTGFGGRQDPLDFVGSDVAMPSTEYPYYKEYREPASGTSWGEPFEFPTFGGPIVFGYNTSSFTVSPLKLSTWTYCAIVNGTISDWNDPAITADNGKSVTGGASETIDFYFRSDSSGTSYLFTNKLNDGKSGCNQTFKAPYNKSPYQGSGRSAAWTFGVNMVWPGPGSANDPNPRFFGESGNPGVLAGIQADTWGTGYVEGAYAQSVNMGQASLQNGRVNGQTIFVSPKGKAVAEALSVLNRTDIQYGMGSDGISLGSSTPWCQIYIPPSAFVSPSKGRYPIVGLSYWLFYGNNNGVHLSDKVTLIKFMASAKTNKILGPLEYTPMKPVIRQAVLQALRGSGSHAACLQ